MCEKRHEDTKRTSFDKMFHRKETLDALFVQPPLIQDTPEEFLDPIQHEYFKKNGFEDNASFADTPVEANWGLMAVASSAKQHGFEVATIDLNLYDYVKYCKTAMRITDSDIAAILGAKKANVYGISSMTASFNRSIEIARLIKRIVPTAWVVLGGIHPSLFPEAILRNHPEVDFVIKGEGEAAFPALLQALKTGSGKNLPAISGLCFLRHGRYVMYPSKLLDLSVEDTNLDLTQWPYDVPFTPRINLSRGCVGTCSYCSANRFFDNTYRTRTFENIITDLHIALDQGYHKIMFGDLSFGCDRNSAIAICEYIITKSLQVEWWAQMRIADADDSLLDLMSRAGCKIIALGFESAETDILAGVSAKKTRNRSIFDVCKTINDLGMALQGYFIIGLPGETLDSTLNTIKYIEKLLSYNMTYSHISLAVPFPGTDLYDHPEQYNIDIVNHNWDDYLMNSDLNGVALPVFESASLSRYQAYALWELALATAAKYFKAHKSQHSRGTPLADMFAQVHCEALSWSQKPDVSGAA